MDAGKAHLQQAQMECRDIAEAYDPLGGMSQRCEIDLLNYPRASVSAAGAEDRFDVLIIDHALKVVAALIIVSGEVRMFDGKHIFCHLLFQPPGPECLYRSFKLRMGNLSRWGNYANVVA
jgi:hypothetical protein